MFALSVISLIYVSDGWTELLGQRIITSFSGAAFEFLRGVALNPSHDELSCLLYLFSLYQCYIGPEFTAPRYFPLFFLSAGELVFITVCDLVII